MASLQFPVYLNEILNFYKFHGHEFLGRGEKLYYFSCLKKSDSNSSVVNTNHCVDSMALGKDPGRTLHFIVHEGKERKASLALVLRKQQFVFTTLGGLEVFFGFFFSWVCCRLVCSPWEQGKKKLKSPC